MADEESEIRRMAEIADAINAILDADPVGDTPTDKASAPAVEPDTSAQPAAFDPPPAPMETMDMPEADAAGSGGMADGAPMDAVPVENPMESSVAGPMDSPTADPTAGPMDGIDTSDLDAAIAAELNGDTDTASAASANHDHFGPAPTIDFDAPPPRNDEIGRPVKDDSQLANLSLRMQDTLAEIRSGNLAHTAGRGDLIGKMEAAREEMMAQVRDKVEQLNADTQSRKQFMAEQIDQIDQQNMMFRDELNIMLMQFEDQLKQLQTQYFESSVSDRDRLDRYREFLQYLLSERGL